MNYDSAYERVSQLKKFYKSLLWFGIVAGIIFFDDIFEEGTINFSLFNGSIILVIWGIILTVKAVKLFLLDAEWENDIIEKEMRKSKKKIDF
ncbi:2TM domain-containing protein [Chryseobacterium antibioticum]|uniref:2TM domain-containing protein n=2 Tax=Chryseobacterium TaxID=59732 RepID=A0A7Y0FR04_9FLAO|nr:MULTISPECIES: 2TM domain-containing protein [Chryseobacterium]MCT2408707.1 2TM domain-containing protein [Chryseobacterium pyrolae]NML68909.1 2TM domain-containing protein [Chryseobacterium antibioticum]